MVTNQELAARNFSYYWNGRGNEDGDYQDFWRDLLHDVFGVERTTGFIKFQQHIEDTSLRIDGIIPQTKVLIEHKSFGVDLSKVVRQSDGEYLTPFEQAKRYAEALPLSTRPRWIVTCNFDEFRIYDLAEMNLFKYLSGEETYSPKIIKLADLRYDYPHLKFLVDPNAELNPEVKISTDAVKIIHKICTAIDKNYTKLEDKYINALSKLCARLVFCFYADDEKLFTDIKFGDWYKKFSEENLQAALQNFFDTLNTPDNERQNFDAELKKFPYVDGGLFDEKIDIPALNKNFQFAVDRAHIQSGLNLNDLNHFVKFSWREISPPIFGAMFEAVFNDDTRRKEGIHYTSPENIHKVIDPLFFDDLSAELADIKRMHKKNRVLALKIFQDKLASINFLDPACGSGNFLTETYLSLRTLENEILKELRACNAEIPADPIKVTPRQFYGIEINGFAVEVAKLALWISEIQMRRKTSWIIGRELDDLPLRKYISIRKANANQIDWKTVAPNVDYIIGNPPFRGKSFQSAEQKADIRHVFAGIKGYGNLDYVACWFKKAADFIRGTGIRCVFLSTNSVCQGIAVVPLWKNLFDEGIHIDFAHRTFRWQSDSENMAHVHCVVIGFSSAPNPKPKKIFDGNNVTVANNINAYLVDDENFFVEPRNKPLREDALPMIVGSCPTGKGFIIETGDIDVFRRDEPAAQKYIRIYLGADEFIDGKKRYCLWLKDCPLDEIKKMPLVAERVEAVKIARMASTKKQTARRAATPTLFAEDRFVDAPAIFVPMLSSCNRDYVPIGFVDAGVIVNNLASFIPNGDIYTFGMINSSIMMAWMKTVGSQFKSDYRFAPTTVYNTFPWPEPTASQRRMIEESAQKILDVRKQFPDWTFAKLYNEDTMPDELRSAHHTNDFNVALAYGFEKFLYDEPRVVAELMKLYKRLTKN